MNWLICYAVLVYFEAAGEPLPGKFAVAEVAHNRVQHVMYPNDVCKVLTQPSQFSFVQDRIRRGENPTSVPQLNNKIDMKAWEESLWVAVKMLRDEKYGLVDNALWYYNPDKANPKWADSFKEVVTIGNHRFMEM